MKKRKAKRRKLPPEFVDIKISEAYYEHVKMKEQDLLKLIADVIVNAAIRELYQ